MLVITYTSEHNHPWPTQRNALAGSTRSSSSPNPSSKTSTTNAAATTSASCRISRNKEEPNNSHMPSFSTTLPNHAAASVKEEGVEERRESTMEFDNDVGDTYRPELLPDFHHQQEDFFADLDELEEDSLTMLLSHSSSGGNIENTTTIPNVFSDFFDDDSSSRSL